MTRNLRLVRKGDFERVYKHGTRARGSDLLVVAAPNGLEHPRLGLSVGRSIWKEAVRRNRIRRVFREAFRLELRALPAGFDLILIPARPRLEPQIATLRPELVQLAQRAARAKPRPPRA
jgi:ribonuclease P protein component